MKQFLILSVVSFLARFLATDLKFLTIVSFPGAGVCACAFWTKERWYRTFSVPLSISLSSSPSFFLNRFILSEPANAAQ